MTGKPRPVIPRIVAQVDIPSVDACWLWTGSIGGTGYATISTGGGRRPYVHRVMYELFIGPIPEGHQIDHLCRNPACVNPRHLEAVTPGENSRRGLKGRLKTHCKHGHEYVPENVGYQQGRRYCLICKRERRRR